MARSCTKVSACQAAATAPSIQSGEDCGAAAAEPMTMRLSIISLAGIVRTLGEQEEAGISQDQEALRIVRFDVVSLGHGSASPRLAVDFRRNVGAKSARLAAGTRGSLPGGRQDPASVSVCRHAPDTAGIAATGPRVLLYWARGLLNSV